MTKQSSVATAITGLILVTFVLTRPAAAQSFPKMEVSGGYQSLRLFEDGEGEWLNAGWYGDLAGNVTRVVGLVFQATGNYKTLQESMSFDSASLTATVHVRVHQFLGGVRFNARPNKTVAPYGQVLLGATTIGGEASASMTDNGQTVSSQFSDSETQFALQTGGGINVWVTRRVGIRAGVDYSRIFVEGGGVNAFRFAAGASVAF